MAQAKPQACGVEDRGTDKADSEGPQWHPFPMAEPPSAISHAQLHHLVWRPEPSSLLSHPTQSAMLLVPVCNGLFLV